MALILPKLAASQNVANGTGHHDLVHEYSKFNQKNFDAAIQALAKNQKLMAVFKGAYSKEVCNEVAKKLDKHAGKTSYDGIPEIGRYGNSFFETQNGPMQYRRYFDEAPELNEKIPELYAPFVSPIDLITGRLVRSPHIPRGGQLRVNGEMGFAGLIRFLDTGAAIFPHIDNAAWDLPTDIGVQQIDCQIAGNHYIQTPNSGGEITIYPKRFSWLEYEANRRTKPNENYALVDSCLPEPTVRYTPETGDIIFFNASFPHAVSQTSGRSRYTCSWFMGVKRDGDVDLFS